MLYPFGAPMYVTPTLLALIPKPHITMSVVVVMSMQTTCRRIVEPLLRCLVSGSVRTWITVSSAYRAFRATCMLVRHWHWNGWNARRHARCRRKHTTVPSYLLEVVSHRGDDHLLIPISVWFATRELRHIRDDRPGLNLSSILLPQWDSKGRSGRHVQY